MFRYLRYNFCCFKNFMRRIVLLFILIIISYLLIVFFNYLSFDSKFYAAKKLAQQSDQKVSQILSNTFKPNFIINNTIDQDADIIDVFFAELNYTTVNTNHILRNKKWCTTIQNNMELLGRLNQSVILIETLKEWEILKFHSDLQPGGQWNPKHCKSQYKIALIIPIRDRQSHLMRFIEFLIPILKRQYLDFRFIVSEQFGEELFNKGRLMNAGFFLAEKLGVNCVIFHDVDMFPQDDHAPYDCTTTPRHLGAYVNTLGYHLWYKEIVGGALAINTKQFIELNGFSNMYWGWGGEDDDMGTRILSLNYTIERPNATYVRYSMLKHVKRKRTGAKKMYRLLKEAKNRSSVNGLNDTNQWKVLKLEIKPLYFHLMVDVGKPPSDWLD